MDPEIRPATEDEIPALWQALGYGFGADSPPEDRPHFVEIVELDRTRCAFVGSTMVGTSGAFSLDLTVPGGSLPTGGTTLISVRTTHRRRGLLRAMMRAHLEDVRERNEPLAALWSSESGIYGRFGYGTAAYLYRMEIPRVHSAFAEPLRPSGSLRLLEAEDAAKLFPQVYDQLYRERPGHFARSADWWAHQRIHDSSQERRSASAFRFALYEEAGGPRGYLQYRIKHAAPRSGLGRNAVSITELQGVDAAARAALWRYALDVDLVDRIEAWNQPLDDPLPWLLADARRLERSVWDSLWVRVVDLPVALAARAYGAPARLVLELRDELCPWNQGTFALEGGPEGAECRPSRETPEIRLGASELGALYLGGNRFQALARAGRIEGTAAALQRADAMFGWDPLPWCPEVF